MDLGTILTVTGLLLDLFGVFFLSISGLLGQEPFRKLRYLLFNVDKKKLLDKISSSTRAVKSEPVFTYPPKSKEEYDEHLKKVSRTVVGITLLILGFILQIIGALL